MGINKLIVGGKTKFDISKDTVTPDTLAKGVTAHNALGVAITGTLNSAGSSFNDYIRGTTSTDINHQTNVITQTMSEGTVTTTFSKQNDSRIITSKIVPKTGSVNYTRTTTIKKVNQTTQIRETLTTQNK